MEQSEKLLWTTTYDTKNGLMIHFFTSNIQVVTNLNSKEVKVLKNQHVIRSLNCGMSCTAYSEFLLSVAKDARKLESFKK